MIGLVAIPPNITWLSPICDGLNGFLPKEKQGLEKGAIVQILLCSQEAITNASSLV